MYIGLKFIKLSTRTKCWDGLGTQSRKQTQTPPNKRSPGTRREREEEVDKETPGAENLKQTPAGWATHGYNFRK